MQVRFTEHYIEHLVEPTKLLVTWQDNRERTRYVVAELIRTNDKVTFRYLVDTDDFRKAGEHGFECYPAFKNVHETHEIGVLDSLMRRLPPRTRADFPQYLENFRI